MHEFIHLLTSWPHWAFEFVKDFVLFVPAYLLGRISLKRHDRKVHQVPRIPKKSKNHKALKGSGSQVLNSPLLEESRIPQRAALKKED